MSKRIGFEPYVEGHGQCLLCPRCGDGYLHHGKVSVFDRGEDAAVTTAVIINQSCHYGSVAEVLTVQVDTLPSNSVGNPSDRRHGMAVSFECEFCKEPLELTIAQHKGMTFMAWRFEP